MKPGERCFRLKQIIYNKGFKHGDKIRYLVFDLDIEDENSNARYSYLIMKSLEEFARDLSNLSI